MKEVRITLLVTLAAIAGYVVLVVMSGCAGSNGFRSGPAHVTCYSAGQAILDTESSSEVWDYYGEMHSFIEAHTGKFIRVTGDCVIVALEKQ